MEADTAPVRFCSECGRPAAPDEFARFGDHMVCAECKDGYAQKLREGVVPAFADAAPVEYAGFWIRFLAYVIDSIILGVAGAILQRTILRALIAPNLIQPGMAPSAITASMLGWLGISSLVSMTMGACYEGFFIHYLAATPGKLALSLRVVRPDGGPVDLGRAFGRYFAKMLSAIILCIGYIMIGFDAEKRGLHDMICDTRVVKRAS